MAHVTAGSDTYGSVRKVGTTRVVTKFAMLNFLPLYPLVSFYFLKNEPTKSIGIPFVFHVEQSAIVGLPLARIDRLSVAMAYIRGVCGACMVFGAMSIVPLVSVLGGQPLDDLATKATIVLVGLFLLGAIGGGLSYLISPGADERERNIRLWCGRVLGIDADPAAIRSDAARSVKQALASATKTSDTEERRTAVNRTRELVLKLAHTRLDIALGRPPEALEDRTDQILERLGTADPVPA